MWLMIYNKRVLQRDECAIAWYNGIQFISYSKRNETEWKGLQQDPRSGSAYETFLLRQTKNPQLKIYKTTKGIWNK